MLTERDLVESITAAKDVIYVQWYFYKRKPGHIITSPTTEQLEDFYKTITACDPYHESFVLAVRKEDIEDIRFIDIDIKNNVLPRLFSDLYR